MVAVQPPIPAMVLHLFRSQARQPYIYLRNPPAPAPATRLDLQPRPASRSFPRQVSYFYSTRPIRIPPANTRYMNANLPCAYGMVR